MCNNGTEYIELMKENGINLTLIDECISMHGNVYHVKNETGTHFILLEQYGEKLIKVKNSTGVAKNFYDDVVSSLTNDDISELFLDDY